MISGFFSCGLHNNKPYAAISCFSECYSISPFPNREQSTVPNINDQFKHLFAEEISIGVVVGGDKNKFVYVSHLSCCGDNCPCAKFALKFVESLHIKDLSDDCIESLKYLLKQSVSPPYMALLVVNEACSVISSFNEFDCDSSPIPKPSVNFRDCFLVNCDSSTVRNEELVRMWLNDDVDPLRVSNQVTEVLSQSMDYWPKVSGMGLTLLSYDGQIVIQLSSSVEQNQSLPALDALKPKGPITAFNYFSKLARKSVFEEFGNMITNNELNKILGQRWKDMNEEYRKPYQYQAELDRQRYNQELVSYKVAMKKMQVVCQSGMEGLAKPLTAYNHFVHQEKQFIVGMNLTDAQTRMGKHGGDRWTDMNKEERELYRVLKESDIDAAVIV